MLELIQRLIAFKYSCKLNHWNTDSYAKHLLFDRLQEDVDDMIDKIAEEYFMANNKKTDLTSAVLQNKYINLDLIESAHDINTHINKILTNKVFSEGIISLLGTIAECFDGKLALLTLK